MFSFAKRNLFVLILTPTVLVACATSNTDKPAESSPDRAEGCDNPLPEYVVTAPTGNVDQTKASFSGVWVGRWDGKLCHTLVVETVDNQGAQVIYSHGIYHGWNIRGGNYSRWEAEFEGNKLMLPTFGNGATASYRLVDGQLRGKYVNSQGGVTLVTLSSAEAG